MVDFIPSNTEQVYELLDLIHFITISVTIPTKIIIAQTTAKESKDCDKALPVFPATGNAEEEHSNQFKKINNVPLQKQCFIILCCSEKTGNTMFAVATELFLAFATIVKTYEIASKATAIIFAALNNINKTLYIIIL